MCSCHGGTPVGAASSMSGATPRPSTLQALVDLGGGAGAQEAAAQNARKRSAESAHAAFTRMQAAPAPPRAPPRVAELSPAEAAKEDGNAALKRGDLAQARRPQHTEDSAGLVKQRAPMSIMSERLGLCVGRKRTGSLLGHAWCSRGPVCIAGRWTLAAAALLTPDYGSTGGGG